MRTFLLTVLSTLALAHAAEVPDSLADLEPGDTFEMGGITFVMMPPLDCSGETGLDAQACRLSEPGMPTADALVAAGEAAVPALDRVLKRSEPGAPRRQAIRVLVRIGEPAVPALVDAAARGADADVRDALVELGEPALEGVRAVLMMESDRRRRGQLMRALAGFGHDALPALRERLNAGGADAFSAVLAAAWLPEDALAELEPDLIAHYRATTSTIDKGEVLRGLAEVGSPGARRVLVEALSDPDPRVRTGAGLALARMDPKNADDAVQDALVEALDDPGSAWVMPLAVERLGRHDAAEITALRAAAASSEPRLAAYAGRALGHVSEAPEAEAVAHLLALLEDAEGRDTVAIVDALRAFGPRASEATPVLSGLLRSSSGDAGRAAAKALAAVGPEGIAVLAEEMQPGSPLAGVAAEGLEHLDGRHPEAVALLKRALQLPGYPSVVAMNAVLEVEPVDASVVAVLIGMLDGSRSSSAASVLGDLGAPHAEPAVPALARHLDGDPRLAWQCSRALVRIGTPEAVAAVKAAAAGSGAAAEEVRKGWAWALKEQVEGR